MEIKIKIPAFFARHRVVKVGDIFYAQKKHSGHWYWMDNKGFAWQEACRGHAKEHKTLEEAVQLIDSTRERVVWSGR